MLLLLNSLTLLMLLRRLIAHLRRCRDFHVVIGGKRLIDGHISWTAMIDVRKLSAVGAGTMLIPHLRPHGRGMLLTPRRLFRRPCLHLYAARSAIEAHSLAAAAVIAHGAVVNIVHEGDIHVVVGTVVVEIAAAPVAALVAKADVTKAIIDAAIVADVRTPVAWGPDVTVAGSRRLLIVGQRRWWLRSIVGWRGAFRAGAGDAIRCVRRSVCIG